MQMVLLSLSSSDDQAAEAAVWSENKQGNKVNSYLQTSDPDIMLWNAIAYPNPITKWKAQLISRDLQINRHASWLIISLR